MKLIKLIKSVIVVLILHLSVFATASAVNSLGFIPYYGEDFYKDYQNNVFDEALVFRLKSVLRSFHITRSSQYDLVTDKCDGLSFCYMHSPPRYKQARKLIVGSLFLSRDADNSWQVFDVYCQRYRGASEFGKAIEPNSLIDSKIVNVEHTWPQSLFSKKLSKEFQKADLHHLFPTDSFINSVRGSHPFGEVTQDKRILKCPESRFGFGTSGSREVFEPPAPHRGNVARAMFYFSIRYDLEIDDLEEAVLRKWHQDDPVDQVESDRNDQIFEIQKNRNPFIDFPELAQRISNF